MRDSQSHTRAARRGLTLTEVLVCGGAVAVFVAAAPVVLQSKDDRALVSQSISNLKNLAVANATYGADWNDRQFTAVPDDAGLVQGDCTKYLETVACPPQQLLGWSADGAMWGYFLGNSGKCSVPSYPGSCDAWVAYVPMAFGGPSAGFGSFRLPNVKAFNAYVNGRFYDPAFYAPKDTAALASIKRSFTDPSEFTYDGEHFEYSSYCFSPAAMWDVKVLARNDQKAAAGGFDGNGYSDPATLPTAFRSPSVSRCRYPSLKTWMIEHNWLQATPRMEMNPGFAPATPWFFNHGIDSSPASLFFDGHIELVGCARAMASEARIGKLWSRNTPLGANGYFGAQSFDRMVATSFHILTTDGIEGRDILDAGDGAAAPSAAGAKVIQSPGSEVKFGSVKTGK